MTAEYHGQIAPGLLALMNQFPPNAYVFRPAAIVSYSKGMNTWTKEQTLKYTLNRQDGKKFVRTKFPFGGKP